MTLLRVLRCMLLIAMIDLLISTLGMRTALRAVSRSRVAQRRSARSANETARTVALAAAFYPRRALCLEQTLVLCWLLRRDGVAAEIRLGVQPRPFQAHAWVEVEGRALAERGDAPLNMVAFPSLGV